MKLFSKIHNELNDKQVFWILLTVIIAVTPHLPRLPIWFTPFLIITVSFRWLNVKKYLRPMPSWLVMLLALSIFVFVLYLYGNSLNRELSVTILTIMTVMKLLETWRKRDAWMIVTLCYFVILTRFFYSQDMLLVIYLLAATLVITHALYVLQHSNPGPLIQRNELRQTSTLLIAGLPLAVLFFLFFPRLGSPIWGSPDLFGQGKTGISEEMSPGSISDLFQDDSTAFRATFKDKIPANNDLYWRGPVLWDFDGFTWSRNKQLRPIRRSSQFLKEGERYTYEVDLEPTGQKYVFALDYSYKVYNEKYFLLSDSEIKSQHDINQLSHYKATSVLKPYHNLEYLDQQDLMRLKALPAGYNPKTKQLVNDWLQDNPTPDQLIARTLRWFASDNFSYTFSPPPLSGDTMDQFLFETKSGFCEHYASAFTFMMRAAGLPSRIVTGYQGGLRNGDYLLIKQSDAHAWSEVWIQGKGWRRVDPTAAVSPLRVESGSQAIISREARGWLDTSWSRKLGERFDAMRHKWNQWIREFNAERQKAIFNSIGFESINGKSIAIILGGIIVLSTLMVVAYLYLIRPKRKKNELDKIYNQYLYLMKKYQLDKHPSEGIMEFCHRAQLHLPPLQTQIIEFNDTYMKLRYSKAKIKDKVLTLRLRKILASLKEQLKINSHTI